MKRKSITLEYDIKNLDRSIGASLSGEIAKRYGNHGFSSTPIRLHLNGTAGQSLGVWNAGGVEIHLTGDANDYVGKGMSGGKITINASSPFKNIADKNSKIYLRRNQTMICLSCSMTIWYSSQRILNKWD